MFQDALPDEILTKIFRYLPSRAFLPTAHVSKRFHDAWLKQESTVCTETNKRQKKTHSNDECQKLTTTTNPLQLGNLYQTHWNSKKPSVLSITLLEYYVKCGWNDPTLLQRVLKEAAARGDIAGMQFLVHRCKHLSGNNDADICTVAGAAGHLKALRWLREEQEWPWDPTEVMKEASENLHVAVMTYVEQNSAGYELKSPSYGDGLPW